MGTKESGFDENIENTDEFLQTDSIAMDSFSKNVVGSLFDGDAKYLSKKRIMQDLEKEQNVDIETQEERILRERAERRKKAREERKKRQDIEYEEESRLSFADIYGESEPVSDEEYMQYIKRTQLANQKAEEIQRHKKVQAQREMDDKLQNMPSCVKKTSPSLSLHAEATKRKKPTETNRGPIPQDAYKYYGSSIKFGIRHIIASSIVVVLAIFAVLVFQLNIANARLNEANEHAYGFLAMENRYQALNIRNSDLENQITQLQLAVYELRDLYYMQNNTLDAYQEGYGENEDIPTEDNAIFVASGALPYTIFNEAGNMIYTVRAGDTLWSIALRIYGNGNRYTDIVAANQMTPAQANNLSENAQLIIPR